MKKFLKEFKEFALKGNVIDMAVGVMIATAFSKIVSSLVSDIFTPLISVLLGKINFASLQWTIGSGDTAIAVTYGQFIQNVVDFFIMALCIFIFVKSVNSLKKAMEKKKEEEKAEEEVKVSDEVKLLTEIRDQLKAR